ncbi:MAG: 1-(5-phosphoribosyl)-5-amino-4-imidazole-carboxylate carboxylase, partial [Anaerovoracaceae bacterium]
MKIKELGFANLDMDRKARTGAPEAVFCSGKTPQQVAEIMKNLDEGEENIMGTRATLQDFEETKKLVPEAKYYDVARIIAVEKRSLPQKEGCIAIVTAGTADIPVAEEAAVTATLLGNSVNRIFDVGVAGIHRLFHRLEEIRLADVVIV